MTAPTPSTGPTRIAVVLACFNRRDRTLACLHSLLDIPQKDTVHLSVHLLDDASTDGTAGAVRRAFPQVHILPGTGQLYWNGGMRVALGAAMADDPDFYLWLNDDVVLENGFLECLLATHASMSGRASTSVPGKATPINIVVGALSDPQTGQVSYGGLVRASRWHPLKFRTLVPSPEKPLECATMNGNCVLVSRAVTKKIGNLDPVYIQQAGDIDYGFRARRAGAKIWLAPGYAGRCEANTSPPVWEDPQLSWLQNFKNLGRPPRGIPFWPWLHCYRQHGGMFWPALFIWFCLKRLGLSAAGRKISRNISPPVGSGGERHD